MFPFVPTNHHSIIRPSSTNSNSVSPSEKNFWNVWTGRDCSNSKTKTLYQRLNTKSQRIVNPIRAGVSDIVGCHASMFIPKDTKSRSIASFDGHLTTNESRKMIVSTRGYIQSEDKVPEHIWIKNLKYSMDTQSNNVILESFDDELRTYYVLRTLRNINIGEEILLWFSDEILAAMYIPFLTPANIRDKNSYTCNTCEKSFENPNPLKIHIATNCERISEHSLWTRLEKFGQRSIKSMYQTSSSPCTILHCHQSVHQRLSAFQPVRTNAQYKSVDNLASWSSSNPTTTMFDVLPSVLNVDSEQAITAAAHLETIVSNMGTSKQGHLCIYCGKLYSRKYGLKIHIRTHTGFKPLKCKYCGRSFGDPSNLNKHVRLHVQGNTVYKCTDCDKVLVRRRDLQRHIQSRHRKGDKSNDEKDDDKSFPPDLCDDELSSSSSDESLHAMVKVE